VTECSAGRLLTGSECSADSSTTFAAMHNTNEIAQAYKELEELEVRIKEMRTTITSATERLSRLVEQITCGMDQEEVLDELEEILEMLESDQ